MKISQASILSCLLMTSLLSISANAQPSSNLEKLVDKNLVEVRSCVSQIEYIDSYLDLELKFKSCLKSSLKNNILTNDEKAFDQYERLMYEKMNSFKSFSNQVNDALQLPEPQLSDAIYNNPKQYKDMAANIVGQYSLSFNSGHSPEGGATLAILKNQRYVIVSFGTVLVGDWRIIKGKYLHLLPYRTEYPFFIFGRDNDELGDTSRLTFSSGDFDDNMLIHYGEIQAETPTLKPIFNADASCFSYPYRRTIPGRYNAFSLAHNPDYKNKGNNEIDIYTFNNDKIFNDFYIFEFNKLARIKAMKVIIDANELIFEEGRTMKRSLPKAGSSNALFYEQMADIQPLPKTLYRNLGTMSFDNESIDQAMYTFDKNIKAYVAKVQCTEDCPEKDTYDNADTFYEYRAIENITQRASKFKIANESVISTICAEPSFD